MLNRENNSGMSSSFADLMTSMAIIFILLLCASLNNAQQEGQTMRNSVLAEMQKALKDFVSGGIEVKSDPKDPLGLLVLVPEDLLAFKFDHADLSPAGESFLKSFIPKLSRIVCLPQFANEINSIVVEGHTDSSGTARHNWDLSQKRSMSVVRASLNILDENGVSEEKGTFLQLLVCQRKRQRRTDHGSLRGRKLTIKQTGDIQAPFSFHRTETASRSFSIKLTGVSAGDNMAQTQQGGYFSFEELDVIIQEVVRSLDVSRNGLTREPLGLRLQNLQSAAYGIDAPVVYRPTPFERHGKEWTRYISGDSKTLDKLTIKYLCWVPEIAIDERFLLHVESSSMELNWRSLAGLVRSCHCKWEELSPESTSLSIIRVLLKRYKGPNRALRTWQAHPDALLGQNGPLLLAEILIRREKVFVLFLTNGGLKHNLPFFRRLLRLPLPGVVYRSTGSPKMCCFCFSEIFCRGRDGDRQLSKKRSALSSSISP